MKEYNRNQQIEGGIIATTIIKMLKEIIDIITWFLSTPPENMKRSDFK